VVELVVGELGVGELGVGELGVGELVVELDEDGVDGVVSSSASAPPAGSANAKDVSPASTARFTTSPDHLMALGVS
jgi:hypothetical protein